jgi:hypothetical protein
VELEGTGVFPNEGKWKMKPPDTIPSSTNSEHLEQELGVAAFLVARGHKLLGLREVSPGHFCFRFLEDEGKTSQAALDFLCGASVVAKDLVSAERSLKTLLYSRPNNGLGTRNFNPNRKAVNNGHNT